MIHRKTFGVVVLFLICVVGWFSITNNSKEKVVQSNQGSLKKAPHHHAHHGCGCDHCAHVLDSPRLKDLTSKQRHSDYTINVIEPATAQIEYKNEAVPMIRQRAVSVNSLMDFRKELAIGDKIRMEFFPDAIVEGTIVKTHQNITGTFGYVAEDESGKNLLFVTENEGRLLATVVGEHEAYRLLYSATTKSHHAIEIDLDAAPKAVCGCTGQAHGHEVEALFKDPNSDEVNVSDTNQLSGLNQGSPITHIVDYMCVYSTNAKNYADASASGIFNVITQALLKANDAFEASNTKTQLRLVHTREFAYNDTKRDLDTALDDLESKKDGVLDAIHADRETYKADLVSFLIYHYRGGAGTYTAGLADTPYFDQTPQSVEYKDEAFSAFEVLDATGYTFAHEIGHNFGCQHARDVFGKNKLQSPNPANTFSPAAYGYTIKDNGVNRTTIMGYTTVNNNQQLPYFSNPALKYNSIAIGSSVTPKANNAGIIRDTTAAYVVNYNASSVKDMVVTSPAKGASLAAEATQTVTWTNSGTGKVKIQLYKANKLVHTFITSTTNDGSQSVTLPAKLGGSSHYQIVVSRIDVNDTLPGVSGDFTIIGTEVFPLATGKLPPGWRQVIGTTKSWMVTATDANEGRYSVKSSKIESFENSGIQVKKNLSVGDIKFDFKTSSMKNKNQKLKFFVNGVMKKSWDGLNSWASYTYKITTAGAYTLKWVFNRDGWTTDDVTYEAWIDNVVLPDKVNQVPIVESDIYQATPSTVLKVNATNGVLNNDSDEGTITAKVGSTPSHGTLSLASNGSFTYTPTNGYVGIDSFTYTASDGRLSSAKATVEITVNSPINKFPYTEGFGTGLGAWLQSRGDDFDWTRNKGKTELRSEDNPAGPSRGKAGANDYYMYTNSFYDNHQKPIGKFAWLLSSWNFSTLSTVKLTFNYHMYGNPNIGKISVEAYSKAGAWSEVWTQNGDQGDTWKSSGVIDLSAYAGKSSVFLRFKGLAEDWSADMAIDNIAVSGKAATPAFVLKSSLVGHNLNWSANYEGNVDSYRIEKLVNGKWTKFKDITAKGGTNTSYSVVVSDASAPYRIVSVKPSGLTEIFSVEAKMANVSLKVGWNLLSTPFANSDLSAFTGALWVWNGKTYEQVTAAEAKSGFWYYSESPAELTFSGTKVEDARIALKTGWNLIGPAINMKAPLTAKLYTWKSQYIDPEGNFMIVGHGYWIYRDSPSKIEPVK